MTKDTRKLVNPTDLKLPECPLPRPGDKVVWYQNAMAFYGTVIGHRQDGKPLVKNHLGLTTFLHSYECLRVENPFLKVGPNWTTLPPGSKIVEPLSSEKSAFDKILAGRTSPGLQYIELINEIWSRGFEIYLVGGTVRDVLSGTESKDIDLVTTMPLTRAFPLIKSMYKKPYELEKKALRNGHLQLGGVAYTGEPFIDLCVFKLQLPGLYDAVFASDFALDTGHRDFACNSVYYEPINKVLIDPMGTGIDDAVDRQLRLVLDKSFRNSYQIAKVIIRFFKFLARGFEAKEETCCNFINEQAEPCLSAMTGTQRINYIRTQILGKYTKAEHQAKFNEFHNEFLKFGAEEPWNEFIEPLREDILT